MLGTFEVPLNSMCPGWDPNLAFLSWVWRCSPVIPDLGGLRQEDPEFEASLDYIAISSLLVSTKPVSEVQV
jgi:hypothetical protein